ncbi:MFS general substrate transporter [Hyaloscypha hepaticicola]|uniref:MFS general substrate transporter n=1 Tax=Hyaloscypha hepaticicola TaxID=2082293 RepID=A0A2J6Q5B3_9HELO|nr:MFS general substrate transporter [Hyaloscypha hepaticicola]
MASPLDIEAVTTHHSEIHHLNEKVFDGDEALAVLHTHYEPYSPEEERSLLWKIDYRMCTLMLIINGIQFIDKGSLTAAATYGIIGEAKLVGAQFSLLISIFYIGYLIAQYPTNILMQRFPTGKYISINFVLWGITLAATGSATNFATLATGRFFLGVFESCLNPGFVLITSSWWKREEQSSRVALWYCANGLFGAPSGAIFFGIAHIHVVKMFPYQWMFIILGLITVVFGSSLWWILPDSPHTAQFLDERERIIAVERLKSNKTGVKNAHHKQYQVIEALKDLKVWMLVAAIFFHNMTNSLQTSFSGLVIRGLGYSVDESILLSIPPGIVMATSMIIAGFFLSSRWGEGKRIFVIILCYLPGIASCLVLYLSPINPSTRSAHLFAITIIPVVATSAGVLYALLASNIAGYTKKSVTGTLFFSANAVANIVSPQTFLSSQAPRYSTGVAVTLAAFSVNILLFVVLYFVYRAENKRRDANPAGVEGTDATEELIDAFSDKTDRENKKLRYKM